MRTLTRSAHERLQQRVRSLGSVTVGAVEERGSCPLCDGPMGVQKTVRRCGATLEHGAFETRETVHTCLAGCRWPSGERVVRRAAGLTERLVPRSRVGYDVMTFIGLERFVRFRQRAEIVSTLRDRFDLPLSTGEVSRLARLFLAYLERLHQARGERLRAVLDADGGWPLHVDASGEDGRGTLLVVMAGWRGWALAARKIPTERAEAILPLLRDVVQRFGPPCAAVRDLGRAMKLALNDLIKERDLDIPILACHLHFLRDVGNDLLDPAHSQLRSLFRRFKVRPALRVLVRDLGRRLGAGIEQARHGLVAWQQTEAQGHVVPDGPDGLATVRALAQWVLDYKADAADQGFPFDRPYLDLYHRCVRASRAVDAFLLRPPQDRKVTKALERLRSRLAPVICEMPFQRVAQTLQRRVALFEELRTALRLLPKPDGRNAPHVLALESTDQAIAELRDVKKAVDTLVTSLRKRRPRRGPAQDMRQAIDLILRHIDTHGVNLWGHAVPMPDELGGGVRLVDRTNNALESFFHVMKRGERRRSGRKILTKDFEDLPAAAALARNLDRPDYVDLLCGTLDDLPRAFAQLDAEQRTRCLRGHDDGDSTGLPPATLAATASLPREDRRLIRSKAMQRKVLAAASSRAPRLGR